MSVIPPPPSVSVQVFEEESLRVDSGWITRVVSVSLEALGESGQALSVVVTDDETVSALNRTHRGLDETTDVLAFSYTHSGTYYGEKVGGAETPPEDPFVLPPDVEPGLGEIVISLPQAGRQSVEAGHPLEKELAVLLAHGILHLLGYDHLEEREAAEMRARESKALDAVEAGGLL